jgi:hypothetical protein
MNLSQGQVKKEKERKRRLAEQEVEESVECI